MDLFACVFMLLILALSASPKCSNESPEVPKYYLMEKCHRSTLGVVFRANYTSLISCQRLGVEKKGLALNFSPPEALRDLGPDDEPIEYTCEVLKCAESDGGVSLVNDTRYDYYSIYAKNLPDVNSTCVPGVGMFYLHPKRLNYTDATAECRNKSGVLADIMSEARTEALAQLLAGSGKDAAYVGVRSLNGSDYVSFIGDTFDCTTYRAWTPGHPKRSRGDYGCVVVTRAKTWRTVRCRSKLHFICELNPSGPYRRCGSIFASSRRNDTAPTTTPKDENI